MEVPHLHMKTKVELAEGYAYRTHYIDLATSPKAVEFRQLFEPSFWRFKLSQFNELDLVRVVAADRSYDILLVVLSKSPGGLLMSPWPRPLPGSPEFEALLADANLAETLTKEELSKELAPATAKRKTAA